VAFRKPAGGRIMRLMLDLYVDGHIKPIRPMTTFKAEDIQSAIRYMQQGTHMGKIVIKFPETADALPSTPAIPKPAFRSDKAYLLAGGMGGLGRAIAVWMVTHGAKYITFLSRSAGKSAEDQDLIHELNLMGCSVQAIAGDVTDSDVVNSAIDAAPVPIAGVMQMAMVLRDVGIMDMDLETYETVVRPRVDGTWNLHNGLLHANLDFFVLFSSICGIVGYYGQANYAASNSFLDAFVQYRHAQDLPASVMENMEAMAGRLYSEQDFLDTLQLTIARSFPTAKNSDVGGPEYGGAFQSPSQVTQALECRLPIMDPQNNIIWKRDPRMAIYRNIETVSGENTTAASGMKPFLSAMQADPSELDRSAATDFLAWEIRNRVATFLMRRDDEEPLELGLTLSAAGVDSLVAIELRNWWKQNLGVDVSVLELMNGGSMQRLGELAAKRLKERLDKTR
jgi:NAD(P)-dependent dehydrogenase (short-subunit alcohol dehydrogenase family)/aryl carrier-like protein